MKPKRNAEPARIRQTDCSSVKFVKDEGTGLYTEMTFYATKWGVIDSYNEVVDPGAFDKSVNDRVPQGKVYLLMNHGRSISDLVGIIDESHPDEYGQFCHAKISSVEHAQRACTLVDEGMVKFFSIGYDNIVVEYNPNDKALHLKEIKWGETSLVLFPANEGAVAVGVKSVVIPYKDYPLTSLSRSWVRPDDAKSEACLFEGYPIAEVIDGGLMVNPNAVKSAIEHLLSPDCTLSDDDRCEAMDTAVRYYIKAGFTQMTLSPVEHKTEVTVEPKPEDAPLPKVTDLTKQTAKLDRLKKQYKL